MRRSETVPSRDGALCICGNKGTCVEKTGSPVRPVAGLPSHPPGSAGSISLPATTKLLACPPASARQRLLIQVVDSSEFFGRGLSLPPN